MNRSLTIILVLLCLSLALPALGEAVPATLSLGDETGGWLESIAALGDTAYLSSDNGIYVWSAGQGAPVKLEMPEADKAYGYRLIAGDGKLYLLNRETGELWPAAVAEGVLTKGDPIALDWEPLSIQMEEYSYYLQVFSAFAADGKLYILRQASEDDYERNTLDCYDLADGSHSTPEASSFRTLCPYKDGLLAGLYRDENYTMALYTLNPATGESAALAAAPAGYNLGGLAYSAKADRLYVLTQSTLYGLTPEGTWEKTAYLPINYAQENMACAVLDSGYYICAENAIHVRSTDPAELPERALRISGGVGDYDAHQAFLTQHPEIPVVQSDTYLSTAEEISQNMVSGENAADLYQLSLSYSGFASLRDKGYCYPLSGNQALTEAVAQMYPFMMEDLFKDGQLIAFPASLYSGNTVGYSAKVMEELGLTQEEMPHTYGELMDFMVDWVDYLSGEHPNYNVMRGVYDIRSQLLSMIFQDYMSYYAKNNMELTFDTPLFRSLLQKLDEVTPILEDLNPEDNNGFGWSSDDVPTDLFDTFYSLDPSQARWNKYEFYPLTLDEGVDPVVGMNLSVWLVNPNSPNVDMALTYLEYMARNMNNAMKVMLCPEANDPVENRYYQEHLKWYDNNIAELEKSLETADEENKRAIQESIDRSKQYRKEFEENERWEITAEAIADYRALVPYLYVLDDQMVFANEEVSTLRSRYMQGEMSADQFIKEFDRKLRMIRLENQ